MKLRSLWTVGVGISRRVSGGVKRRVVRVVHEGLLARLRVDALIADRSRRPRILSTACGPFPIYSQTFVYQEVCALAERGFDVRFSYSSLEDRSGLAPRFALLWSLRRWLPLTAQNASRDFEYYQKRLPQKVEALKVAISRASGLSSTQLLQNAHFLQAFSFTRMVAAWRPDYLHSYFFYERTFFTLVASSLLDIPRGVSCYADHALDDYPLKLVALNVATADVVVATSQRIKRELVEICGGGTRGNILVKPNGIDLKLFRTGTRAHFRPGDRAYVVSVCRIEPKKGLRYLVDAMDQLRGLGVEAELHLVGAPDEHDETSVAYARDLKEQVAQLGLGSIVCFEGRQTAEAVRGFLSRAHVFVAPFVELENGDKDGISTAILEAMAARCAIVATDAGSTTEAIDPGENGIIVPQRDAAELAAAIRAVLADPALAARLGQSAREKVARKFDVGSCEEGFHQQIRLAIARRVS